MSYFVDEKPEACLKCSAAAGEGRSHSPFLFEDNEGLWGSSPTYTCLYCGAQHFVEKAPSLEEPNARRRSGGGYHIANGVKM